MKWYEWFLVVALVFLSNVFTLYIAKEYLFKVKVVDLLSIGLYTQKELYDRLAGGEDPQRLEREVVQKTRKLEEYFSKKRQGIVLIKQCVLSGDVEDITNEVANYLRGN